MWHEGTDDPEIRVDDSELPSEIDQSVEEALHCPLIGQVGQAVCYIDPDVLCTSTRERRFHTMLADHCVHTRTRTHTHTSTPTHTHTQTHIYNCSLFYNPGGQMHMPSAQFPLTHPGTQSLMWEERV